MAAAASRSPSPTASEEDTPAVFLTPRSKIKQLLAAVDESSDEDTTPGKKTSPKRQPVTTSAPSASSSEASDDDIIRPRGKFASRMLAQSKKPREETEGPEEDARQRVRRILDQSDADESTHDATATDVQMPDADQDQEADEDEDVVVTKPRKLLQRRKQRSVTPEGNAPTISQSPGLFVSPAREESPGLFVTPSKHQSPSTQVDAADDSQDDAELPVNPLKSNRFLKILERKRKEREAREAEEAQKHAARLERAASVDFMSDGDEDEGNITDDEGGHKLTQEATRPTRKASKKALEDMNRETQRMSRSLQLAHEAKTKKKVTKASLFERFNFRPAGNAAPPVVEPSNSSRPSSPVSGHQTDAEAKDRDTPPSSPPSAEKAAAESTHLLQAQPQETALAPDSLVAPGDTENSSLDAALEQAAAKRRAEKGKEIAATAPPEEAALAKLDAKQQAKSRPGLSVRFQTVMANLATLDSDDEDLEILPAPKQSRVQELFTNLPKNLAKESRPLHALRSLAQLDDPDKKPSATRIKGKHAKPSMSVGEMQFSLQQKARDQARQERDRRMEVLRAKGIHIQSAEEREQEIAQVEDMVARARREAEEIQEREREAAKKDRQARKDAGELDPLAWDDSEEDGSYGEEEPEELELSGSDEEGEGEEGEEGEEEEEADKETGLFDEAAESTDDGGSVEASDRESEEETDAPRKPGRGSRKRAVVLSDDEDDERVVEATPRPASKFFKSPSAHNNNSPQVPTSVLRSATKTFIPGLPIAGAAAGGLGLTQIFAGTMDDSQTGSFPGDDLSAANPMPSFGLFPDSNFSQTARDTSESMILDSQREAQAETQGAKVDLSFSQSQFQGFDSLLHRESTQLSEMIEPSQDKGFMGRTPLVNRFVAISSTMETVLADGQAEQEEEVAESPLVKRMGKLRRRNHDAGKPGPEPASEDHRADTMETDEPEEDVFGLDTAKKPNTAFNVMRDAAAAEKQRKAQAEFDKAKSKARGYVEEQAEESEDEYAGLGGADGEGSDDDDDASVKEMFDDETKNTEADERKLAAFYADRERAADEKQIDKLFRDVTTGMLRRKRRGSFGSLSDSDDGGEAHRRLKRRQFAKMQKALFADERISKVAENPRTQAFMRSIQDFGVDDDMDFILAPQAKATSGTQESDSQDDGKGKQVLRDEADVTIPNSQPQMDAPARRPGPQRRTAIDRRPATIGEIRETLSNLLEDTGHAMALSSESVVPTTDFGSDSEAEDGDAGESEQPSATSNKENQNPRRGRHAVVDRISLKRNNSSDVSTGSHGGRLAFAAGSSLGAGGSAFKVPALLRRATTNSLMSNSSSSTTGSTTHNSAAGADAGANGGFGTEPKIKRNASKRSGVNYFARENDRRALLAEQDKRREAKKINRAEGRGKIVGGLFAAGKFE